MATRLLLVTVAVTSLACGADTATQPQEPSPQAQMESARPSQASAPAALVPQNPGDRSIRRELNLAIDSDSNLKDREISFIVSNGDVSVTGIVRTERERQRMNDLALGIPGVKSVANALRISE